MSQQARRYYPTDLSDEQWLKLEPLLPKSGSGTCRGGRPSRSQREMLNAILYVVKTGCPWRYVPREFGPWSSVYSRFRPWREQGVWEQVMASLRVEYRERQGRCGQASAGCIDSQSVKVAACGGSESVGFDGGKKVKGRKRHVLVDTLGLIITVVVTAADVTDARGARSVMERWWASGQRRLRKVWADSAYAKEGFGAWLRGLKASFKIDLEVTGTQKGRGFQVIAHRWVVERTFAWLFNYRRLVKDYEATPESSEALIQIAMSHLLLKRLAK